MLSKGLTITVLLVISLSTHSYGVIDYPDLADRIAASINTNITRTANVDTIAFWKVDNRTDIYFDEPSFRDNLDIAVLDAGRFDVVDRTNLERMFEEMELSLTGLVDQGEIQRFGDLYGIQAFIYGDLYNDITGDSNNYCIVIKCIDTRTGQLIFGNMLPLYPDKYNRSAIDAAVDVTIDSLKEEAWELNTNDVDTIAVWDIRVKGGSNLKILTDKLTAKMTTISTLRIVDRENLQKLLEEQATGTSELFDQSTAAEIGKLYGVDAFLYGTAEDFGKKKKINLILKMVDTEKGILRWGERIEGTASLEKFEKRRSHLIGWIALGIGAGLSSGFFFKSEHDKSRANEAYDEYINAYRDGDLAEMDYWKNETKNWDSKYSTDRIIAFTSLGAGVTIFLIERIFPVFRGNISKYIRPTFTERFNVECIYEF